MVSVNSALPSINLSRARAEGDARHVPDHSHPRPAPQSVGRAWFAAVRCRPHGGAPRLQLLEVARPTAEHDDLQDAVQHEVHQRDEHAASDRLKSGSLLFYGQRIGIVDSRISTPAAFARLGSLTDFAHLTGYTGDVREQREDEPYPGSSGRLIDERRPQTCGLVLRDVRQTGHSPVPLRESSVCHRAGHRRALMH